jgi:hypothetical protein
LAAPLKKNAYGQYLEKILTENTKWKLCWVLSRELSWII